MLPKKNRVSTKEVDKIFKEGRFLISPSFTFKYTQNPNKEVKISFIAPKSVAKLAVKRNLLRRRGYTALSKYIDQFPLGIMGVFVFKKYQASPVGLQPRDDISAIENEIKTILSKLN
ncbi:MAG: ribonuclease P protein component [Candidatus Pacebacteria bacterium]|nr:ribonuclease P protein component [Candidatus Paceibacterota bacterium]